MEGETARKEMEMWKKRFDIASAIAVLLAILIVVFFGCIATYKWDLKGGYSIVIGCVLFVLLLSAIWYLNKANSNYMKSWKIAEAYEYRRALIHTFSGQSDRMKDCLSQSVLAAPSEPIPSNKYKTVVALRADYKFAEMLIDVLSIDPSKNISL